MRLREILKDKDLLKLAEEAHDVVDLCERVSRRHGLEMTLEQGRRLLVAGQTQESDDEEESK